MINDYIKKLRRAADALEDLLASDPFDHPKIANAIGRRVARNLNGHEASLPLVPAAGGTPKGFKYKGTHWMQQPENKRRVQALQARAARSHRGHATPAPASAVAPTPPKRRYAPGQHWTQKPENATKLARLRKGAARKRRAALAARKGES